jgi:hypothetical protein
MALYAKSSSVTGAWVKGSELRSGTKCKLVSETTPQTSQFKNKDGSVKMQDVAKIRLEGDDEPKNISLNRATIDALVDAFGEDSSKWIGKTLTAETEKTQIAGKRVTVVYLVPDGYEVKEDLAGYVHIVKSGSDDGLPEINIEEEPAQDDDMPGGF